MSIITKFFILTFIFSGTGLHAQTQAQTAGKAAAAAAQPAGQAGKAAPKQSPEEIAAARAERTLNLKYAAKTMQQIVDDIRFGDEKTRSEASGYLAKNKPDSAVEPLIEVIKDDNDVNAGVWAIRAMIDMSTNERVNIILVNTLLKDDERSQEAALVLGHQQKITAVDYLINALMKGKDYRLRKNVAWALGEIGNTKAGRFLYVQYNREPSALVKAEIMDAMSKMRYDPSLDLAFEEYAKTKNTTIKAAALIAMGRSGLDEALPHIKVASKDKSPRIRNAAKIAFDEYQLYKEEKK